MNSTDFFFGRVGKVIRQNPSNPTNSSELEGKGFEWCGAKWGGGEVWGWPYSGVVPSRF